MGEPTPDIIPVLQCVTVNLHLLMSYSHFSDPMYKKQGNFKIPDSDTDRQASCATFNKQFLCLGFPSFIPILYPSSSSAAGCVF